MVIVGGDRKFAFWTEIQITGSFAHKHSLTVNREISSGVVMRLIETSYSAGFLISGLILEFSLSPVRIWDARQIVDEFIVSVHDFSDSSLNLGFIRLIGHGVHTFWSLQKSGILI